MPQKKIKKPVKPVPAKVVKSSPGKQGTIKTANSVDFLVKNSPWIVAATIVVMILVIFFNFISGNAFYIFKDIGDDSMIQVYPRFKLITRLFSQEGFPLYSIGAGMGSNLMWAVYDLFSWIIIVLGYNNVANSFIWMELVKIMVAGVIFYYVLGFWKLSPFTRLIGALLYSFSGFMIVGGGWTLFSSEACYLALLLLGFEMLYHQDKWYLFPLAITFFACLQPFDLYLFGLFFILYFLFRHFTSGQPSWKKFFLVTLKMAGLSLLGLLIGSFFFLAILQVILNSPRVGGHYGYFDVLRSSHIFFLEKTNFYLTAIFRLLGNDMMGNGSQFRGWHNYLEAPMFYIGLLPALLMPQIFLLLSNQKRAIYGAFLGFFLLLLIFPHFRYAYWLFTGDYFRGFGLFISLIILLFSMQALDKTDAWKNANVILLLITLGFWLIILYYPYHHADQFIKFSTRSAVTLFLIIYTLLILAIRFLKNASWPRYLLFAFIIIELGYFNYHTVNDRTVMTRTELKEKKGYNDYSQDAVNYINARDKGFFRISRDSLCNPSIQTSLNDAEVQGYYGTSLYNSFNPKSYVEFLEETGNIEKGSERQSRWAPGLLNDPLLLTFASNKYYLRTRPQSKYVPFGYDYLATAGNVKIFENRHFLPLGFTYDKFMIRGDFLSLPYKTRETSLFKAVVLAEKEGLQAGKYLEKFNMADTSSHLLIDDYYKYADLLKKDILRIDHFRQTIITGTIDLKKPKLLFISIPYDEGWHFSIDGKPVKTILCNIGFMGVIVPEGHHAVEMQYRPALFYPGLYLSLAGIGIYLIMVVIGLYLRRRK